MGESAYCSADRCLEYGLNPQHGTISFDSFYSALMTVYTCITGEGWTDAMYMVMRGNHPSASLYFIALTLFGSFYVVNLFLAVLWETYSSFPVELTPDQQVGGSLLTLPHQRALWACLPILPRLHRPRHATGASSHQTAL